MRNKKAWIRIIEASFAVLLITAVLLIIIEQGYIGKDNVSSDVYDKEISILRRIEFDEYYRFHVLRVNSTEIPLMWEDFPSSIVYPIRNEILNSTPSYLECEAQICWMSDSCVLNNGAGSAGKEVYAQSVMITADILTGGVYSPRQLKMFCWEK